MCELCAKLVVEEEGHTHRTGGGCEGRSERGLTGIYLTFLSLAAAGPTNLPHTDVRNPRTNQTQASKRAMTQMICNVRTMLVRGFSKSEETHD